MLTIPLAAPRPARAPQPPQRRPRRRQARIPHLAPRAPPLRQPRPQLARVRLPPAQQQPHAPQFVEEAVLRLSPSLSRKRKRERERGGRLDTVSCVFLGSELGRASWIFVFMLIRFLGAIMSDAGDLGRSLSWMAMLLWERNVRGDEFEADERREIPDSA